MAKPWLSVDWTLLLHKRAEIGLPLNSIGLRLFLVARVPYCTLAASRAPTMVSTPRVPRGQAGVLSTLDVDAV